MRIQHNIPAMNSYRNYNINSSGLSKNLEKLSSGYKINRAGDDAAGLAISEKMRAQITGLDVAQKNAKDGISVVQTAEGALTEVHSMLNRMYALAEQSANGIYSETERTKLQDEIDQLTNEIDRIADSTNFNGIKLLDGSLGGTTGTSSTTGTTTQTKSDGTIDVDTIGVLKNSLAIDGHNLNNDAAQAVRAEYRIQVGSTAGSIGDVSLTSTVTIASLGNASLGDGIKVSDMFVAIDKDGNVVNWDAGGAVASKGIVGIRARIAGAIASSVDTTITAGSGVYAYRIGKNANDEVTTQYRFEFTAAAGSDYKAGESAIGATFRLGNNGINHDSDAKIEITTDELMKIAKASSAAAAASLAKAAFGTVGETNMQGFELNISVTGTVGSYQITAVYTASKAGASYDLGTIRADSAKTAELYGLTKAVDPEDIYGNVTINGVDENGKVNASYTAGAAEQGENAYAKLSFTLTNDKTVYDMTNDKGQDNTPSDAIDFNKLTKDNGLTGTKLIIGSGSSAVTVQFIEGSKSVLNRGLIAVDGDIDLNDGKEVVAAINQALSGMGYDKAVLSFEDKTDDNKDILTITGKKAGQSASDFLDEIGKVRLVLGKDLAAAEEYNENLTSGSSSSSSSGSSSGASASTSTSSSTKTSTAANGANDKGLVLQIGDTAHDYNRISVSISSMKASELFKSSGGKIDLNASATDNKDAQASSRAAMETIQEAIDMVSSTRGELGALQNRLEHTINNLSVTTENLTDAEATIRDTDVAEEMMKYTKNSILNQAAQAMLAQANQLPQGALQLLG